MSFASVYIDESGSHQGSPVLCLAGFLFKKEHAELLAAEWAQILAAAQIPYMRMSLFTKDGQKPFDHLSRDQRIEIAKHLIEAINRHKSLAFVSAVNEEFFNRSWLQYMTPTNSDDLAPMPAYVFCLNDCLVMIRDWAQAHEFNGTCAYFFEAGHKDQAVANYVMSEVFRLRMSSGDMKYSSHSFVDKHEGLPLQSADMLAWLAARSFITRTMRQDYMALLTTSFDPSLDQRIWIYMWNEQRLVDEMKFRSERLEAHGWKFYSSERSS